jgi:FkbM family methyltransferase
MAGVKRIVISTEAGSFYIDPVSDFGARLSIAGAYEPDVQSTLTRLLSPRGVFVDVGANEGYFSVIGAKLVGPEGRVVAVEPQTRMQEILKTNFALNKLNDVQVIPSAISNVRGSAPIFISADVNPGSTSLHLSTKYKLPTESVETMTLSDVFLEAHLSEVDLLKMDIEGGEYEAILASPELFVEHRIRTLALELHPTAIRKRGLEPQEIGRFLASCGYRIDHRFSNEVWTCAPAH